MCVKIVLLFVICALYRRLRRVTTEHTIARQKSEKKVVMTREKVINYGTNFKYGRLFFLFLVFSSFFFGKYLGI